MMSKMSKIMKKKQTMKIKRQPDWRWKDQRGKKDIKEEEKDIKEEEDEEEQIIVPTSSSENDDREWDR